jgi:hypothetical protein
MVSRGLSGFGEVFLGIVELAKGGMCQLWIAGDLNMLQWPGSPAA